METLTAASGHGPIRPRARDDDGTAFASIVEAHDQSLRCLAFRLLGHRFWHDPFAVEGVPFRPAHVTLHGGALERIAAEVVVDPRSVPHLWALAGDLVVTVSGDLSRDELIEIAQSLGR